MDKRITIVLCFLIALALMVITRAMYAVDLIDSVSALVCTFGIYFIADKIIFNKSK